MNRKILYCACAAVFLFSAAVLSAADLTVTENDIRLQADGSGGYHLYIRKKDGAASVLLTETTKDPEGSSPNYAYRAKTWNAVNGDERRMLNGEFLVSENAKYSLIDSTPEADEQFGLAFHIYIPSELEYGYEWTRHGTVPVETGTFINIRMFEKPYADYTGEFSENPFMFNFKSVPEPILTDLYNSAAADAFKDISEGRITYSKGPETLVDDIIRILDGIASKDRVDIVFAVDTTGSMKDDMEALKKDFGARLEKELEKFGDVRMGLLLYRDYGDNYKYKNLPVKYFPFTRKAEEILKNIKGVKILGTEGGDIPEAVYEALYAAINFYEWDADAVKKIVLIGDAEPHKKPRGSLIVCTRELIERQSAEKGISIDAVIVPDGKDRSKNSQPR
ncbi:MAG: VWA domain-containing protein [Bacteroides sp.]|nr:VWA domain-containing protein [Prevotella sp.]MCM1406858.1 VWA domain-containing protein [Treponema brennaborense]MCM1470813.1 VWA domain-containing protein [Bacteroides sp.]